MYNIQTEKTSLQSAVCHLPKEEEEEEPPPKEEKVRWSNDSVQFNAFLIYIAPKLQQWLRHDTLYSKVKTVQ